MVLGGCRSFLLLVTTGCWSRKINIVLIEVAAAELTAAAVVVILVVAAAVDFLLLVLHKLWLPLFSASLFFQSAIQNRVCMLYTGMHFDREIYGSSSSSQLQWQKYCSSISSNRRSCGNGNSFK